MTVLEITVPEKKEKEVRLLLKEMGVTIKKIDPEKKFTAKIKTAVKEMNAIKKGEMQARDFNDLLNEL